MTLFDVGGARRVIAREIAAADARLANLGEADWRRPTRCAGWTVADVVSHMGLAACRQAEAFRRAAVGSLEPPEYPGAPELAPNDMVAQLRRGAEELDAALGTLPASALEGLVPLPLGVVPAMVAVQIPVFEYALHGNDLASALGEEEPLAGDVAAAFMDFAPGLLPMLAAGVWAETAADLPSGGLAYRLVGASSTVHMANAGDGWSAATSAEALPTCVISGDDSAVALFCMGRLPSGHPTLKVSGPAHEAARDFKRRFPGP